MTFLRLTILLIVFSTFSCEKECNLSYEIIDKEFIVPFYYNKNKMLIKHKGLNFDRYERIDINESEISYIQEIVKTEIHNSKGATEYMKDNICNYSMQVGGVFDKVESVKKIYLNVFCGEGHFDDEEGGQQGIPVPRHNSDGKVIKFHFGYDGGDCHFQAVINVKTDKLAIIYINGEA